MCERVELLVLLKIGTIVEDISFGVETDLNSKDEELEIILDSM